MPIRSFGDPLTEDLFHGRPSARVRRIPNDVARAAARKLDFINAAQRIDELASPPGNRLERLRGSMEGLHSIRVNDQWRLVFRWTELGPAEVTFIDYH
ncbi:MAG: Toxin HigB-1 [Planctomycetes bacterium]|nr:Toxin HigB-1 [Planctomycetota bacterium]